MKPILAINQLTVSAINGYQKYLSPIKGYQCASGVLYGDGTCSGVIKSIVSTQGVIKGAPAIAEQFNRCHQAAKTLSTLPDRPDVHAFCCVIPIPL